MNLLVQSREFLPVLLHDRMSLDLEGGGHKVVLHRERFRLKEDSPRDLESMLSRKQHIVLVSNGL